MMNDKEMPLIFDVSFEELSGKLKSWGQPGYRAKQIWEGLYKQLWAAPTQFSNIPKSLRDKLESSFRFSSLEILNQYHSSDHQTSKMLYRLPDGHPIETILMQYHERISLCVSSQAGCALGCTFCATGQMGFKRNLTRGEIVEQVISHAQMLKEQEKHLTNIVIMGMGEPFLNYEAVMTAINLLNDPTGLGMGERRFTISTAGIVPGIRRFTEESRQINLAVSLHAANDALRSSIMPVNKKYPLNDLINACRDYTDRTSRRITFEWALMHDFNDRYQDAQELIRLTKGMLCHVNLIPLNPIGTQGQQASSQQQVNRFKQWLDEAGISNSIRLRRGIDILAGCGQLAGRNIDVT